MENCTLDRYKLAWMQDGLMRSTMHPTLSAARAHELKVPSPRMIMELRTHNGSAYSWKLLPGPWADAVRHWQWLALAVAALVVWLALRK
jgi:hypothetical protein